MCGTAPPGTIRSAVRNRVMLYSPLGTEGHSKKREREVAIANELPLIAPQVVAEGLFNFHGGGIPPSAVRAPPKIRGAHPGQNRHRGSRFRTWNSATQGATAATEYLTSERRGGAPQTGRGAPGTCEASHGPVLCSRHNPELARNSYCLRIAHAWLRCPLLCRRQRTGRAVSHMSGAPWICIPSTALGSPVGAFVLPVACLDDLVGGPVRAAPAARSNSQLDGPPTVRLPRVFRRWARPYHLVPRALGPLSPGGREAGTVALSGAQRHDNS